MRKIAGIGSIIAGLTIFAVIVFAPGTGLATAKSEQLSNAGAMLGTAMFGIVPLTVLVGLGVYLLTTSGKQ